MEGFYSKEGEASFFLDLQMQTLALEVLVGKEANWSYQQLAGFSSLDKMMRKTKS